jgi:hypothetical protein
MNTTIQWSYVLAILPTSKIASEEADISLEILQMWVDLHAAQRYFHEDNNHKETTRVVVALLMSLTVWGLKLS